MSEGRYLVMAGVFLSHHPSSLFHKAYLPWQIDWLYVMFIENISLIGDVFFFCERLFVLGVCLGVTVREQGEFFIFAIKGCTCLACVRRVRLRSVSRVRSWSLFVKAVRDRRVFGGYCRWAGWGLYLSLSRLCLWGLCLAVTVGEETEVLIFVCKGCTSWACVWGLLSVNRVRYGATSAVTLASVFVVSSYRHDVRQERYYRPILSG